MTPRALLSGWIAAGLVAGCAAAPPAAPLASGRGRASDPERWERAACVRGDYPTELDSGALARAHQDDVRARQSGATSPVAVVRLTAERDAFEARCRRWLSAQKAP